MGLLKIIRKVKRKEKEIRILLLGLDNAGKSTVLHSYLGEETDLNSISPTLGFDIKTIERQGFLLNIWDVGGQTTIRAYWKNYFEETEGVVFVVDSADTRRLMECKKELFNILHEEKLFGASVLILCNKSDLNGALALADIAKLLEVETNPIFKKRHTSIVSCSAARNIGVSEGITWLVKDIASRIYVLD